MTYGPVELPIGSVDQLKIISPAYKLRAIWNFDQIKALRVVREQSLEIDLATNILTYHEVFSRGPEISKIEKITETNCRYKKLIR